KPPGQLAVVRSPACPAVVSDRRYPMRNRDYSTDVQIPCGTKLRHKVMEKQWIIEKPDPCGPGSSSSAREPTINFQRGTMLASRSRSGRIDNRSPAATKSIWPPP